MKKNSRIKRFLALYIDLCIIILPSALIIEFGEKLFPQLFTTAINIILSPILFIIYILSIINKDTFFSTQYRSLGKKIMSLYIVDSEKNIVKDKSLIRKKNIISLKSLLFFIYKVLIFNKSEAEEILNIQIVTKYYINH